MRMGVRSRRVDGDGQGSSGTLASEEKRHLLIFEFRCVALKGRSGFSGFTRVSLPFSRVKGPLAGKDVNPVVTVVVGANVHCAPAAAGAAMRWCLAEGGARWLRLPLPLDRRSHWQGHWQPGPQCNRPRQRPRRPRRKDRAC